MKRLSIPEILGYRVQFLLLYCSNKDQLHFNNNILMFLSRFSHERINIYNFYGVIKDDHFSFLEESCLLFRSYDQV